MFDFIMLGIFLGLLLSGIIIGAVVGGPIERWILYRPLHNHWFYWPIKRADSCSEKEKAGKRSFFFFGGDIVDDRSGTNERFH